MCKQNDRGSKNDHQFNLYASGERRLELVMAKLNRSNSRLVTIFSVILMSIAFFIFNVYNIKSFVDMMHSHSAVNLINLPTWFPRGQQPGAPSPIRSLLYKPTQ